LRMGPSCVEGSCNCDEWTIAVNMQTIVLNFKGWQKENAEMLQSAKDWVGTRWNPWHVNLEEYKNNIKTIRRNYVNSSTTVK
jgi:hypothetical protein